MILTWILLYLGRIYLRYDKKSVSVTKKEPK